VSAEPILEPEDELLDAGPGENESEAGLTFDQAAYLERLHLIDLDEGSDPGPASR